MFKQLLIIGVVCILLWVSSIYISSDIAKEYIKNYKDGAKNFSNSILNVSDSIKSAKSYASTIESQIQSASALLQKATQNSDASLIMKAADEFSKVLEQDPENQTALQKLAKLSMDFKVFEKAASYYKDYLKLKPDDLQASINYIIALTKSSKKDEALNSLRKIRLKNLDKDTSQLVDSLERRIKEEHSDAMLATQEPKDPFFTHSQTRLPNLDEQTILTVKEFLEE